jgi:hypothetical protein
MAVPVYIYNYPNIVWSRNFYGTCIPLNLLCQTLLWTVETATIILLATPIEFFLCEFCCLLRYYFCIMIYKNIKPYPASLQALV